MLLIVLQIITSSCFSQKDRENYDTLYLKEYNHDLFYPYGYTNVKNHSIYFSNIEENDAWVKYKPNAPLFLGFGFDYKWMTFSYAFPIESKTGRKGKSFNLFYGMSRRKFRFSLMYQQYKGFFLDDSNLPENYWENNDRLPFREDLRDYILQGKYFYIFNNKKISYRSSFLYFEKQLKSAGSYTFGANFFVSGLRADSSIIPKYLDTSFHKELNEQKILDVNFGLNFGYMHTWVFLKNYHLSFHFSPSIHFNKDRLFQVDNNKSFVSHLENSFFIGLDFRLVLGYDNEKYFGGLAFFGTNTKQNLIESSFSSDYSVLELYFGKRIDLKLRRKKMNIID